MEEIFYAHVDQLSWMSENKSVETKVRLIHQEIYYHYPFIDRIAIALYKPDHDLLHTFITSCIDSNPLIYYDATLKDTPSLLDTKEMNRPRVVNDMGVFEGEVVNPHTKILSKKGYGASYTIPIFHKNKFRGFLFVNSYQKDVSSHPTV